MAFKSPTLILLHIRVHLSHWLNSITSCGGTVQKLSPFTPVYCYHSVVACFFSVYQVMKISIKSHHFEAMKCGEMCSRMYFPLQLKYAGLNFFSFFFFLLSCCTVRKILSLLERFPACTMFPGIPYRAMPMFITCRRNRINR